MGVCFASLDLLILSNFYLATYAVLFGIAVTLKSWRCAALIFITFSFYLAVKILHCPIKTFDTDKVWRYLIWTIFDILYLCTVYLFLVRKQLVKQYLYLSILLMHLFAWALHLIRFFDVHFFKMLDLGKEYSAGIAFFNLCLLLLIGSSLVPGLLRSLRRRRDGCTDGISSIDNDGNFRARDNHCIKNDSQG